MIFYLGTHMPGWLNRSQVPLFISDRRLRPYVTLPKARAPWALDSGGFSELSQYGSWSHAPRPAQYIASIRRYVAQIGHLAWAAPQDWMCEPHITAKTGRTVAEHQALTTDNYLTLTELGPELPIIPVIQGHRVHEYLDHVALYRAAGVDLNAAAVVGVGSICRRQATKEVNEIFTALRVEGLRNLHGFGLKKLGMAMSGHLLTSADSMAWSFDARRKPALPGCAGHKNCANCERYAMNWRRELLAQLG